MYVLLTIIENVVNTDALDHHYAATDCPNCSAAVSGNFCHQCGQETVLHPASTREFVHEFIGHYVALEGKLWKSLGLLLFRPGRLTLEYIKGRRVRYVQPLRLYLTFSLIFFAVMKYGAHDSVQLDASKLPPAHTGAPHATVPADAKRKPADVAGLVHKDKPGEIAELIHEDKAGETTNLKTLVHDKVALISVHAALKADAFFDMPSEEKSSVAQAAFYGYAPYAVFFMMPLFALYLKALYLGSGRRYGEHLLFALHGNGFAFAAMTLVMLLPEQMHLDLLKWLLQLWLLIYLPIAMRRVYGGGRILTGLRWMVLMLLHLTTISLAVAAAVLFGIMH
jgi:hypothetical protein